MRLTSEQNAEIVRAYINGDKLRVIAAHFGVTQAAVSRCAERAGLPRRKGLQVRAVRLEPSLKPIEKFPYGTNYESRIYKGSFDL